MQSNNTICLPSLRNLLMIAMLSLCSSVQASDEANAQQSYLQWATEFWQSLTVQRGTIELSSAQATLLVPDQFYYLNPYDTSRVLTEVWGNPPVTDTLGMLMPTDLTPFDENSWAVMLQYQDDGFVADTTLEPNEFGELLDSMLQETQRVNEERLAMGFDPITLEGWAAEPHFNAQTNKLYWAKQLRFGDDPVSTLNYNIRVLGRYGVLLLNFVGSIEQRTVIEAYLDVVLEIADFDTGARYEDFKPETDTIANYPLSALIAGDFNQDDDFVSKLLQGLKQYAAFILLAIIALMRWLSARKKRLLEVSAD